MRSPATVLAAVTVLWASTFLVTKELVGEVAPLAFLAARFSLGAVVLLLFTGRRLARLRPGRAAWRDGAVLALVNSSGLLVQVFGQVLTTPSKSAFVTSLNTPLTPVMAYLLYRARPSLRQVGAVALASLGVLLLTYPGAGAAWNPGDLLTLGCATLYAITIVEIARRSPRHDAICLTTIQVVWAAVIFVGVLLLVDGVLLSPLGARAGRLGELLALEARAFHPSPRALVEIAYMGVVCTAITFTGQTWAMGRLSATHAAIIFALEPVFVMVLALAWRGASEWPGPRGAAGAALVLAATLVSELRLRRRVSSG